VGVKRGEWREKVQEEGKREQEREEGQAAPFRVRHSWLLPGNCGAEHTWLLPGNCGGGA